MSKDDGGPAFPRAEIYANDGYGDAIGMSLRDWFAGMALQGMLTHGWEVSEEEYAESAYAQADAMLEARRWEA